jgi:TetR/AcrR family transcriptional regulator
MTTDEGVTRGPAASSERSRAALLDAALTEFAEHGFAGARVAAIADRAGVNKQLISYHFGGKLGLYRAIEDQWSAQEEGWRAASMSLEDLVTRYLEAALADPRGMRLMARGFLEGGVGEPGNDAEVADLDQRQRAGEIAPDLDTRAVLLAVMGMVSAPLLLPAVAGLIGDDLDLYAEQLRRIVRRLSVELP